jgi:hypothetical protein
MKNEPIPQPLNNLFALLLDWSKSSTIKEIQTNSLIATIKQLWNDDKKWAVGHACSLVFIDLMRDPTALPICMYILTDKFGDFAGGLIRNGIIAGDLDAIYTMGLKTVFTLQEKIANDPNFAPTPKDLTNYN